MEIEKIKYGWFITFNYARKKKETTNKRSLVKEIMQITVIYMPGIRNPGQFFNSKYLKLF